MNQKLLNNAGIKMKAGKLRTVIILLVCFLWAYGLYAEEIKNSDKPAKGESTFDIKKVWEIDTAGEDPLGNIDDILISAKGRICCYDNKNMKYYLFDGNGKFILAFGTRGEGPGEIKQPEEAPILEAGNKIVVQDVDRIHYFSWEGKYNKSVVNPKALKPTLFLSENEFIQAPLTIHNAPDGIAKVRQINLTTGERKVLTEFTMFKGGTLQTERGSASIWADGLTPMFILGKIGSKLYYGVNDKYKVYISDMDGKVQGSFSLTRQKTSVSEKEKIDFISRAAQGQAPDDLIRRLAKQLPNEETYFSNIEEHNGLIYIYVWKFFMKNTQQIDIFSPQGKYLYRKIIKVEPKYRIGCMPVIDKGYAYLGLEDDDGEITLNKYEITLPKG
ncbi:MAG: 6-bladed beta-propeller [Candidatus Aminicenantes bacterium]|jgi:hypothetical protein